MKRFTAVVLFLALLLSSASAMTADDLALYHNLHCADFGAATAAPGEINERGWLYCAVTDGLYICYQIDAPTMCGGCYCLDEPDIPEFLAQCVTICYVIGKQEEMARYYSVILKQFIQARKGEETEQEDAGGLYINIRKSDFFIMTATTKGF